MQIWHDDLGVQDDPHETQVLFRFKMAKSTPTFSSVSRGDCAAASLGWTHFSSSAYADWYRTVLDLMLHGY